MNKKKILIFVSYYLPGYKAGGPAKTIANLVDTLGDEFDFYIVTRDRDKGDDEPYKGVSYDSWISLGKAKIMYVESNVSFIKCIFKLMREQPFDSIYLNSFFDVLYTFIPILLRGLFFPSLNVVLAPRGEFSPAAMKLNALRKKLYLWCFRRLGLYRNIRWQASSSFEMADIINIIDNAEIRVAIDMPSASGDPFEISLSSSIDNQDKLRVIFLSRISRMKNLDYAISLFEGVESPTQLDIYGPIEDAKYWSNCLSLIEALPNNIDVNYLGKLEPFLVSRTLANYDLFLLPTLGENYGHVIAESLLVGTPVLISDRTPWSWLEKDKLGWSFPLSHPEKYISILNSFLINHPKEKALAERKSRISRAKMVLFSDAIVEENRKLFSS